MPMSWLLSKNRSWGVLLSSMPELLLAVIIGINFSVAVTLMGKGMLLLGALGGSIGFGIQQAMQMTGSQGLGFIRVQMLPSHHLSCTYGDAR